MAGERRVIGAYSLWGRTWSEEKRQFVGSRNEHGVWHSYEVPAAREALENSKATWGRRGNIEGGIPMLWPRADLVTPPTTGSAE